MARKEGTLVLGSNLEIKAAAPADARLVVEKKADLLTYEYPYPGMIVSVTDDGTDNGVYQLVGSDASLAASWSKIGSGDAGHVELTQAQYNALTPEEKNNGTVYFITDGEGGGGGGGGSYVLPPATANTLGGVKVGSGLSVTSDGILSATGGGTGDANFEVDEQNNMANVNNNVQYLTADFNDPDTLGIAAYNPGTYMASRVLATKDYVDAHATEYTAGENIAIDANNVISANSIYVDKHGTTLWTGNYSSGNHTFTLGVGTWDDYDEIEFWGQWGGVQTPQGQIVNFTGTLLGVIKMSELPNTAYGLQYIVRWLYNTVNDEASISINRLSDNTGRLNINNGAVGSSLNVKKIVGIKYANLGAVVGSVTQNGNNLPIVNNTLSFNTPRAISTRMDGEITGMRVVEDGGGIPATITFNRNIDGVQVIMEDEAERLNTVLVDKDAAQTLTSPNGTKYKLKVADDGTLSTEVV